MNEYTQLLNAAQTAVRLYTQALSNILLPNEDADYFTHNLAIALGRFNEYAGANETPDTILWR